MDRSASSRSLPSAVRREIAAHARAALRCLDRMDDDPEAAVHELRTRMKRARSLLRLLEKNLPPSVAKELSTLMRHAKNALAGDRDAAVMRDWLHRLGAGEPEGLIPAARTPSSRALPRLRVRLGEIKSLLRAAPLGEAGEKDVREAFSRSFQRMKRAAVRCQVAPSPNNIHTWRKRVKDVWYQGEFLAAEGVRGTHWKRAKKLSSLLGNVHDLDMLATHVSARNIIQAIRERRLTELREGMACWGRLDG